MAKFWTTTEIAKIQELAKLGQSASMIGARFGVTRNSIIGVMHRNRVPSQYFAKREEERKLNPPKPRVRIPRASNLPRVKREPAPRKVAFVEKKWAVDYPYTGNKTLLELQHFHCRAVVGEIRNCDTLYCGRITIMGKSWCKDHYDIYFRNDTIGGSVAKTHTRDPQRF